MRNADCIIAINRPTKAMLRERGVEERKIKIIRPGVDLDRFQFVPFKEKESCTIEVITVGFLIKRKAVDLIIKAIREVVKSHKNVHLRVIGDGPQMEPLRRLSGSLGLNDYVTFEGFVPNSEVWKYYREAHIFASMSRSESWGQVYLEAMASGLPIISAVNVGSSEIIEDGVFGYLVEQEDYNMLAERLVYLVENSYQIADFGRNGRAEAEKKYDWETVIIPQYLEIYDTLSGCDRDE